MVRVGLSENWDSKSEMINWKLSSGIIWQIRNTANLSFNSVWGKHNWADWDFFVYKISQVCRDTFIMSHVLQ